MTKKLSASLCLVACIALLAVPTFGIPSRSLVPRPAVADCGMPGGDTGEILGWHGPALADYPLAEVRGGEGAPRHFIATFADIANTVQRVEERKDSFLRAMLPMVLAVNDSLYVQRQILVRLEGCLRNGIGLPPAAFDWLNELAERYNAKPLPEVLLRHVDIVPPALVLAQAAIESGWGQSRFVREGNALFGERTTNLESGIKPAKVRANSPVRVAAFERPLDSVISYMRNLNTHPAYAEFRELRASMRASDLPLDAMGLAGTLHRYSERSADYVRDLRMLIAVNNLTDFDTAWLRDGGVEYRAGDR